MKLLWVLRKYLLIPIVIGAAAIVLKVVFIRLYDSLVQVDGEPEYSDNTLFTEKQLAEYDGIHRNKLYLSVMGSVFDVTEGKKHYAKGAPYNYFIGKDGSRALITGKFKDESKNKDHVIDLKCHDLFALLHWSETFHNKYEFVGNLIGRYYNEQGQQTSYTKQLDLRINQCNEEMALAKQHEQTYPPCNIAWSADEGSRVWCTTSSGGISRNWIGVPRQLYSPGDKKPRCVCINPQMDNSMVLLKEYDNCPTTSSSCVLKSI